MTHAPSIAGVVPQHVVTPETLDELAETVRGLYAEGKAFAFVGGGTELELGNAPRALDTVVRTSALDRVVDYAPEDQTITVEAGMTFAELDRILGANRQMFPLDVIDRERATIGGVVAANTYGRRRLRYGAVKDLIVGVTIVRPDGVRARGGGKVVKNVAGFDLPKLMVGSLGTLGAIAAATFRVYPVSEAVRAAVLHLADPSAAAQIARTLIERRLEPESVAVYNRDALVVTFAGTSAGVDAQMATLLGEIAPTCARDASELTDLERESYDQRERAVRRDGDWRIRVVGPPAAALPEPETVAIPEAVPVAYPLLGVAYHAVAAQHEPATLLNAPLRIVHAMPPEARARVDAWGPPPPSFPVMRALKERFDPSGLCNPGRFVGGL